MLVVNTDVKYYVKKTPERCIHEAKKAKKKNLLEACLQQCHQFFPFIVSVNGLLVVDAEDTLKRVVIRLKTKW